MAARVFLERLSQQRDLDLEIVLANDYSRPHAREKFRLADDAPLGRSQNVQDVERPAAEPKGRFVPEQLAPLRVESKSAEPDLILAHGIQNN